MRTGNNLFKYYTYAVIWSVNIIAGVKGYSIDKAYQIDAVFGSMVERQIKIYEEQFQQARNFAASCGAYYQMIGDFKDFGKYLREDLKFWKDNKNVYDYQVKQAQFNVVKFMDLKRPEEAEFWRNLLKEPAYIESAAHNAMIAKRLSSLYTRANELTLEKLNYLPRELRPMFTDIYAYGSTIPVAVEELLNEIMNLDLAQADAGTLEEYEEYSGDYDQIRKKMLDEFKTICNEYYKGLDAIEQKYKDILMED